MLTLDDNLKLVMLTLAEASDCSLQRMLRRFFALRTIGFFAYAQNNRIDNRYSVAPLLTLRMTRLNYA